MIFLKNDSIHMRWTKDIYTSIEKYYQKLHVFLCHFKILHNNFYYCRTKILFILNLHCNFINNQFHVQYIYKKKHALNTTFERRPIQINNNNFKLRQKNLSLSLCCQIDKPRSRDEDNRVFRCI